MCDRNGKYFNNFDQYYEENRYEYDDIYRERYNDYSYDEQNYNYRRDQDVEIQYDDYNYNSAPIENNIQKVLFFDWAHSSRQPIPVIKYQVIPPPRVINPVSLQPQNEYIEYNRPQVDSVQHLLPTQENVSFHDPDLTNCVVSNQKPPSRALPKWIQDGLEKMEKEKWKKTDNIKPKNNEKNIVETKAPETDIKYEQLMKKILSVATKILLDVTKTNVKLIGIKLMNNILANDSTIVSLRESSSLNVLKENFLSSGSNSEIEESKDRSSDINQQESN